MRSKKVLLVEKNSHCFSTIGKTLVESGYYISKANDGPSAFEKIARDHFDLVITELHLPQMNGIDLLKKIKGINGSMPVILTSTNAGVEEAVEAMKLGAYDFILKPLTVEMIKIIILQISNGSTVTERKHSDAKYTIITKNSEMNRLLQEAQRIANSQASILIQGESGTGKELLARYIHAHSNRKDKSFVAINCSALPETLLESELFGHEKGSFTGAVFRKKGKFELANHGTMLLDEISEMNTQLQSKLLRVLQEKEVDRVGGIHPISIDVRIIATTNMDINKQLKDGRFREDLFYRLNIIPFHLPPLRERKDDIPLLANYFVQKYNSIDKKSVKGLTEAAVQELIGMAWKGNVRELENIIERAILMCKGEFIDTRDLYMDEKNGEKQETPYSFLSNVSLKEMEEKAIFHALDQTNGNRTHAAEILGISVRTLRNKLNEYREKMANVR